MYTKPLLSISLIFCILITGCSSLSDTSEAPNLPVPPTVLPTLAPTVTPLPPPMPTPVPATRIKQAELDFFYGDYDAASAEFDAVMHQSGDPELRAASQLGMGRIHFVQGNYETATQAFITVIEYYSDTSSYPPAVFYLGETYNKLKQYKQAAEAYYKYLTIHSGALDAYVYHLLGDVLDASGDLDGAAQAYQESIKSTKTGDTTDIELIIGQVMAAKGDQQGAVKQFMAIYDETKNDYTKATANLLAGRAYLALQMTDQAYARFQDSVKNYPSAYDSYSALVALVNDNQPVSDLDRGIIDYNVGQYGLAMDALNKYILSDPKHDGSAHYYRALAAQSMGDFITAVNEYTALINDHPDNQHWLDAWQNKATLQWYNLYHYDQAAQTLQDYVTLYPTSSQASDFLFQVGRLQERNNRLPEAAATWERLIKEYPDATISSRGLFLAGITQYRLSKFNEALTIFQRYLVLSTLPDDQAGALLWIGKSQQKLGKDKDARDTWTQAAQKDPDGFYGSRCRELLLNMQPLAQFGKYDFSYNLDNERPLAESWLRNTFTIPPSTNLSGMGTLQDNPHIQLADAFWELGFYTKAAAEYDLVRNAIIQDPVANYQLLNHLMDRQLYKPAILISRQILDLAGLDDYSTRNAPIYFNHIRFGVYYPEIVQAAAAQNQLDPVILLSLIRQESFFEGFAGSSAGAMGLMQLMPATGKEQAKIMDYPKDFQDDDLFRPIVNIRLGASYFAHQRNYFGDDIYKMLAAYNAGPGRETQEWINNAQNDPDLFVEVIRYAETRTYVMNISSFINSYRFLYEKTN
jgi:soluble lytic murein transglycosylase